MFLLDPTASAPETPTSSDSLVLQNSFAPQSLGQGDFKDGSFGLNSNAMVMDLLSSIQLDCFDDSGVTGFQFSDTRAPSPFQQAQFNDTRAPSPFQQALSDGLQFKDGGMAFGNLTAGSASPLSAMYSPLSEPGTPVVSMAQVEAHHMVSPQMDTFDSDPQVNMFASPQMSEYVLNSPPMTPLLNSAGPGSSPLLQSYSLPTDLTASPILGSPDMTAGMPLAPASLLPPPTIGLNSKKEQVYKCGCGKSFKKMHSFELHSKLHQRDRAYECGVCYKRFLRPHDLKRHKLTHIDGYKPFECSNCGITFTRQDAMHRHINAKRCMK